LLAVWSDPSLAVTGRGPGAGFEFAYLLNLSALPIGSLEIVVTPGGDNVLNALAALTAQGIARERRTALNTSAVLTGWGGSAGKSIIL